MNPSILIDSRQMAEAAGMTYGAFRVAHNRSEVRRRSGGPKRRCAQVPSPATWIEGSPLWTVAACDDWLRLRRALVLGARAPLSRNVRAA